MKLSFLIWNIHGASNYKTYRMPDFVANRILNAEKDIVILTEFIRNSTWEEISKKFSKTYWIYSYPIESRHCNEILIMVKKDIRITENNNDMESIKPELLKGNANNPNFLQIKISEHHKSIYIIGVRLRYDDYPSQIKILNDYFSHLPDDACIICGGDFNAWPRFIRENLPKLKVNTPKFSMEKDDFQSLSTWSAVLKGEDGKTSKAIIDHILTRNISEIALEDYAWDFVTFNNGYGQRGVDEYKSDLSFLPDHGILSGVLTI